MRFRPRFQTSCLLALSVLASVALTSQHAQAQKVGDGREAAAAELIDDGFRPVWQQQRAKAPKAAQRGQSQPKPQQVAENRAASAALPADMTVHGRWTVTCQDASSGAKKACSAAIRIVDSRQQIVIFWEIGRAANGTLVASMQTPTGVLVQKGVDLKVGDAQVGKFDYAACVPQNCEAGGAIDDTLLKTITSASEMMVTIHAKDGRDVNFKFPIDGIDQALAAIRS